MNKERIVLIKRLLVATLGALILGFGCGLTVVAAIGSDPVTVFITALANLYPVLSVGNWTTVFCLVILIITFIINKRFIGYTTVCYTLIGQFAIDFCLAIVPAPESFILKVVVLLLGITTISLSVAVISAGDLGYSAYDAIIFALANKLNTSYKKIRYTLDIIFLVVGYLIGGVVGVGTIICLALAGYIIDFFVKKITPLIKKIIIESK